MLRLTVRWPDGGKATFCVEGKDDTFLGRIPSINEICIQDPSISRKHAQIKMREEGPMIYDLKSLNGVFLNGARVSRAVLKNGDELRLGSISLEVSLSAGPEDALDEIEKFEATSAGTNIEEIEATDRFDMNSED